MEGRKEGGMERGRERESGAADNGRQLLLQGRLEGAVDERNEHWTMISKAATIHQKASVPQRPNQH